MIYMPYLNYTEVKMPAWETIPQGIYIPRAPPHYNANNKHKKGKNK